MSVTRRRIALVLALTAWIVSTAAHMAAQQGPPAPSAAAVADSEAVAATHRSRTLAALFEEFRTTTPENARINSRAISNLFSNGNPLMRLVSSEDFSAHPAVSQSDRPLRGRCDRLVQSWRPRLLRAPRPRRSALGLVRGHRAQQRRVPRGQRHGSRCVPEVSLELPDGQHRPGRQPESLRHRPVVPGPRPPQCPEEGAHRSCFLRAATPER